MTDTPKTDPASLRGHATDLRQCALVCDSDPLAEAMTDAANTLNALAAEKEAAAERMRRFAERDRLFVDALSEIKATVDGQSVQPISDIINGLLAELPRHPDVVAAAQEASHDDTLDVQRQAESPPPYAGWGKQP